MNERKKPESFDEFMKRQSPLWFVGAISLIIGIFAQLYFFKLAILRYESQEQAEWPTVAAEVLSAAIKDHQSCSSSSGSQTRNCTTTYAPKISVRYTVAGKEYESDRYVIDEEQIRDRDHQKVMAEVARYVVGSTTTVHYHPDHPDRSVIQILSTDDLLVSIYFSIIFAVLGIGMGGILLFVDYRTKKKSAAP